jgi:hypothetical protein
MCLEVGIEPFLFDGMSKRLRLGVEEGVLDLSLGGGIRLGRDVLRGRSVETPIACGAVLSAGRCSCLAIRDHLDLPYRCRRLSFRLLRCTVALLQGCERPACEASSEGVYDRVPDSRRSGVGAEVGHVIV